MCGEGHTANPLTHTTSVHLCGLATDLIGC